MTDRPDFPFTAVAGQVLFKTALLLNAVNPAIGGVLVNGPRGSAKSTLARSLANILPAGELVTLPLGASEDMLLGSLNLEQALQHQQVGFQPGLLARAHQGVLYVDEVNLLQDHLTDQLLDVAASGVNRVERDGISHEHSAHFILLGTMNPDEGELRGQLQDRFGLALTLSNRYEVAERVDIVRLREAFQRDPQSFCQQYADQQQQLKQQITTARNLLPTVVCDDQWRIVMAERCAAAEVDGLRADIVWLQAALAHAALAGRECVQGEDIAAVEELVLHHRRRQRSDSSGSSDSGSGSQGDGSQSGQSRGNQSEQGPSHGFRRPPDTRKADSDTRSASDIDWGELSADNARLEAQKTIVGNNHRFIEQTLSVQSLPVTRPAQTLALQGMRKGRGAAGAQRCRAAGDAASTTIDWLPSLLNGALLSPSRKIQVNHLVFRHPVPRASTLHIVLLDTSASVLQGQQFGRAKACIAEIAERAYLKREQFVLFGFGHNGAHQLLTQRRAPKALQQWLDTLEAGGGTPFRAQLEQVQDYQRKSLKQNPVLQLSTYVLSDGRYRQSVADLALQGTTLFIDTENVAVKRGRGVSLAKELKAHYHLLSSV